MKKSAVFFDIDGTIWDYKHHIPQSTVDGIRKLRENGHYAFLSSGRSRSTIQAKELLEIGFDGILAGCGTYIEFQGEILKNELLPYEQLRDLIPTLSKNRIGVFYEGPEILYVDFDFFQNEAYAQSFKQELGDACQDKCMINERSRINKMSIDYRYTTTEDMLTYFSDFDVIVHNFGSMNKESESIAEILPKGFSKATSIQWITDYLGIDQSSTYAFGDSSNDIEMLQYVKYGVAMGNGNAEIKRVADYVTTDMYDDGIWNGLTHFGLIS